MSPKNVYLLQLIDIVLTFQLYFLVILQFPSSALISVPT